MKKNRNLHHRMVFSYAVVFGIITLLIMSFLYVNLSLSSREQARLNYQVVVGQPLKQLDRFLSEMDDVAYKVMTNEVLIHKFTDLRQQEDAFNHYERNVLDSIDTATVIAAQNNRLSPVRRIILYNDQGDFISSGAMVDAETVSQVLKERDVYSLMEHFRAGMADYTISLPQKDPWINCFTGNYFTLTRPVMNLYSRDVVGIVEVQHDKQKLEQYLAFAPDNSLAVNVYDADGQEVLLGARPGDVSVASASSETYGWTVELWEPSTVQRDWQRNLLVVAGGAWLVLNVAMFGVISAIARRISRPLVELTAATENVKPGGAERIRVSDSGIREITALESAFNNMLERLTLSMDQEKKSFLLAMQAQMNPHFLYNVLSVVNAVALEGKSDVVAGICGDMSAMLRYSSSYANTITTVEEELTHTVAYLDLMKARYDYMFTYTMEVSDALRTIPIPKLIIQPICENCFAHAFSHMDPPYRVDIRIVGTPEYWRICVIDNGGGFTHTSRQTIIDRANNASYEDLSNMSIGGLGLVSAVIRLKLMTGCAITCNIFPRSVGGSLVEITIEKEGASH